MNDMEIIREIEKELKIKLNLVDKLYINSKCYTLDQYERVKGISLVDLIINDLHKISEFLISLNNLNELFLIINRINDINALQGLISLTKLDLSGNLISDIKALQGLTSLAELYLIENRISNINVLQGLTNLTKLDLNINQISDINALQGLTRLTKLNLSNNRISDISALQGLTNLTKLNLNNNQIFDISALQGLTNLTELDLSGNQIFDICELKGLTNLRILDLCENKLKILPEWIIKFDMVNIIEGTYYTDGINLFGNPLESPPLEIVKQGKEAVKNYFEQLKLQGEDLIYEAKLMIVGEPGVGKTCLSRMLFDRGYDIRDPGLKSTTGIKVRSGWEFTVNDKINFSAHVLHQFFLTSDCLYVLMAEKRKELANFDYWLNILHILGKDSPIIILFNEIDRDNVATFIYDEKKYKYLFPDMNITRLDINLAEIRDGRFDTLINNIRGFLKNLPHVGQTVPARWKDIRLELEKRKGEKRISVEEYYGICKKFQINRREDQELILNYFHLLGIALYFKDDPQINDTLFLDPNWTVNAVYSILSDKTIEPYDGRVEYAFIKKIWDKNGYTAGEQAKILSLMLKDAFELCYVCPTDKRFYIVPSLLPKIKPQNLIWNETGNLTFRFQYPFMPERYC